MCSSMLIASQGGERERVSLDVTGSYVMLRLQRTMQEWLHGKDRFRSVQRNKKDTIANCNGDLKRTNTHRRSCTHPRTQALTRRQDAIRPALQRLHLLLGVMTTLPDDPDTHLPSPVTAGRAEGQPRKKSISCIP